MQIANPIVNVIFNILIHNFLNFLDVFFGMENNNIPIKRNKSIKIIYHENTPNWLKTRLSCCSVESLYFFVKSNFFADFVLNNSGRKIAKRSTERTKKVEIE